MILTILTVLAWVVLIGGVVLLFALVLFPGDNA